MSDDFLRRLEPGRLAPVSAQFAVFDNEGNYLDREVTVVAGTHLPPILGGGFYLIVDETQHKGDSPQEGESP